MHKLERHGISYGWIEYSYDPANLDVRKIAEDNRIEVSHIFKTLAIEGDKTGLLVAVVPGHLKLNRKALAKASGNKKISLVSLDKLEKQTGYIRGGCCPIGMKSNPPIYIDSYAKELGFVFVNAGRRGVLLKLRLEDLLKVVEGEVMDLGEEYPKA